MVTNMVAYVARVGGWILLVECETTNVEEMVTKVTWSRGRQRGRMGLGAAAVGCGAAAWHRRECIHTASRRLGLSGIG